MEADSDSDAIRKPVAHQRNEVALTESGHSIDRNSWFRDVLLGDHVGWAEERMPSGEVKEVATVPFDVHVGDDHLGMRDIRVDHAMHRTRAKNAPPTYLKWSGLLPVIRAGDFRGWWLELVRLSDGTFRLRLVREEPSA